MIEPGGVFHTLVHQRITIPKQAFQIAVVQRFLGGDKT